MHFRMKSEYYDATLDHMMLMPFLDLIVYSDEAPPMKSNIACSIYANLMNGESSMRHGNKNEERRCEARVYTRAAHGSGRESIHVAVRLSLLCASLVADSTAACRSM